MDKPRQDLPRRDLQYRGEERPKWSEVSERPVRSEWSERPVRVH